MTENYQKWVAYMKQNKCEIPPMTRNQVKFAEWLLLGENREYLSQIGNMSIIFESIRKYTKS